MPTTEPTTDQRDDAIKVSIDPSGFTWTMRKTVLTDKSKTDSSEEGEIGFWVGNQSTQCDHTVTQRKDDFVIVNLLQTFLQTLVSVTPLFSEIVSSVSLSWKQYRIVLKCTDTGINQTGVQNLPLPPTSPMSLGQSLHLPEPQCPNL